MDARASMELGELRLDLGHGERPLGTRVLAGLVNMAERALAALKEQQVAGHVPERVAAVGRLRGTGRGVSWSHLVDELEREHPLELVSPFEGSERVSGGVWMASAILGGCSQTSVAKLRWESRAVDLPIHVHDHSDRFILVHRGRGFFHVTDEPVEQFTGRHVRSVPARERDVFLFSRGVAHTFSTDSEPMVLLSCQLPFLRFEDPRQYRLPAVRWTAAQSRDAYDATVACDAGWSVVTGS